MLPTIRPVSDVLRLSVANRWTQLVTVIHHKVSVLDEITETSKMY